MKHLLSDFRLGVRTLASNPGLTAAAVAALALGVGANSAIFSLVDAVLLRPPPVRDPGELVSVRSTSLDEQNLAGAPSLSYLELLDIARDQTVFEGIAGHTTGPHSLTGGEGLAERIWGSTVTGNFFGVLGVQLPLGTGFSEDELDPSTSRRVVVLSHELWVRRFGASREAIGRSLEIDGERYVVVGVVPLAMSRLLIRFVPSEERPSDDSEYVFIDCDIVGPNYFRTMGIPLLRGRDFTYQDNGDLPVVIVNDAMARQYWGRDKTSSGNVST
jgi:hypothetical protein